MFLVDRKGHQALEHRGDAVDALILHEVDRAEERRFDRFGTAGAGAGDAGRAAVEEGQQLRPVELPPMAAAVLFRSEEHTSELQSLMRISYAVFCLKKKKKI